MQVSGADSRVVTSWSQIGRLNGLEIEQHSIAMYVHRITSLVRSSIREFAVSDLHCTTVWPVRPTSGPWGGCKILKLSGGGCPQTPRKASALCAEVRTNVVCPCCALALAVSWLRHCLKTFRTWSIGWALFGVNFRTLQEIEAIMGGGLIFDTGPFFVRLRYRHADTWKLHEGYGKVGVNT